MRLFIAIELSDEIKDALAAVQRELRPFDSVVRWARREQLHLTLKFLGEVPDTALVDVIAASRVAAEASRPFEMALDHCGCFPPRGAVRIVWGGLLASGAGLQEAYETCEGCLEEVGFAREDRKFSPHVTIGRVKHDGTGGGLRDAVMAARLSGHRQDVDEWVLMSSTTRPTGAQYSVLERMSLTGA